MKKLISTLLLGIMLFTLVGCGSSAAEKDDKKLSVSIEEAVTKSTEGMEMGMAMPSGESILKDIYQLSPSDVEEYVINIPMMNVKASEVAIIKAKSGKLDTVKKAVEARKASLEDQWKTYLPDQYELVKKGRIVTVGDYLLFIICEDSQKVENNFKALFK